MWDFTMEDEEDTWSLMAVVNECARRVKLRGVVDDDGGGGGLNTINRTTTAIVDVGNNHPKSFTGQFDVTSNNVNSFQNYPLFSADQFDVSYDKYANSLQNTLFSSQIHSTIYTNSVESQTLFSHQFDAKYNNLQNPLFSSQSNSTAYTNSVEIPSLFSHQFDAKNSNSLQNSLFSGQIDSITHTNSVKNYPSLFSHQFDAKKNKSIENSLFASPYDITTYTNSLENPPFPDQQASGNNNPMKNSTFSGQIESNTHTNSVENHPPIPNQLDEENNSSIKNTLLSDQIESTTHTNSEQNPPLSNQPDTKNTTSSMKNPPSLFPEKFGAHTRNSSGCDHHFLNLYKHFTVPPSIKTQSGPTVIAPLQDFTEVKDELADDPVPTGALQQQQLQPPLNYLFVPKHTSQNNNNSPVSYDADDNSPRRRRKFENRSVYRVNVDDLAKNDKWAWRKYGQKPIKGSPYPRNYYKCSSIKGCAARKQVERSPIDSETYVVTYTGHHHHPCPTFRNNGGHRSKGARSNVDPAPGTVSPISIMETHHLNVGPSRSESGDNVVILDGEEDLGFVDAGAGAGSVGVGGDSEERTNEKIDNSNSMDINNADEYENRYEFRCEINKCEADANTSVQEKGTNGDYDNWDSEMIKTQFLF